MFPQTERVSVMPTWVTVVVAVCGCTGGFNLISLVLQHRWNKKEKKDERLDKIEVSLEELKDSVKGLKESSDEQRKSLDEQKNALEAQSEAQRASMEERIRYLVGHYNCKGEISLSEKANLKDMHKRYVGIGGNGNLDTEMELLDEIPVHG